MTRSLAIAFAVCLVTSDARAATRIWLSSVGVPDGTVTVDNQDTVFGGPGGSGVLYVWIRPEDGQILRGVSLALRSTTPEVIDFASVTVYNPTSVIGIPASDATLTAARWEAIIDSTTDVPSNWQSSRPVIDLGGPDDNEIRGQERRWPDNTDYSGFGAFTVLGENADVVTNIGGEKERTFDPLYDPVADAWLFATIGYDVIGIGTTDLYLQVGGNGIVPLAGSSSDVNVVFGGGDDPPLNADDDYRETNSATRDGSITVVASTNAPNVTVPEPSTLFLAALTLIGLAGYRCVVRQDSRRI